MNDSLLKNPKGKEILSHVTIKGVKKNFGHDMTGFHADFYLGGKKMGYFDDDGWGGEPTVAYETDKHKEKFETFLKENNVAQIMFENGWDFVKTPAKISFDTQVDEIISCLENTKENQKFVAKIQKDCLKGIAFGTEKYYSAMRFRIPLKELVEKFGQKGVEYIQVQYNKAKQELKTNERILNTNLEELGIKL